MLSYLAQVNVRKQYNIIYRNIYNIIYRNIYW